eukprot:8397313-Pyramimonas_sp.AAC.1
MRTPTCCIFEGLEQLHGKTAKCVRHRRQCEVKSGTIFVCGFSCKGVSRTNQQRSTTTLSAGGPATSTSTTFYA